MFDCDKGFPIEDLLDKTVIFELDGLLSENQLFLTTLIMRFIFEYRISNKQRGRLRHVILFDEAKMVYDRNRDNIEGLGPNEVTQFTSQIREFGEGLVVADQMPIILSESIKSNVYTTICMSQSGGKNIDDMARAMHLKQDQIPALTQLISDKNTNRFEAIVRMSGKWTRPFIIEIIPLPSPKVSHRIRTQHENETPDRATHRDDNPTNPLHPNHRNKAKGKTGQNGRRKEETAGRRGKTERSSTTDDI